MFVRYPSFACYFSSLFLFWNNFLYIELSTTILHRLGPDSFSLSIQPCLVCNVYGILSQVFTYLGRSCPQIFYEQRRKLTFKDLLCIKLTFNPRIMYRLIMTWLCQLWRKWHRFYKATALTAVDKQYQIIRQTVSCVKRANHRYRISEIRPIIVSITSNKVLRFIRNRLDGYRIIISRSNTQMLEVWCRGSWAQRPLTVVVKRK